MTEKLTNEDKDLLNAIVTAKTDGTLRTVEGSKKVAECFNAVIQEKLSLFDESGGVNKECVVKLLTNTLILEVSLRLKDLTEGGIFSFTREIHELMDILRVEVTKKGEKNKWARK